MHELIHWLLEPFQYTFMLRALAAVWIAGCACSVIGAYVVLRGMAFLGDALAHAILPGIAVGYLVSGGLTSGLFWWGMGTAIAASLGIGTVSRKSRLKKDTTIGIFLAGLFALGIALISTLRDYAVDLSHLLFGNVLSVSGYDLGLMAGFGLLVLVAVGLFYKEFLIISFDPVLARTLRLPVRVLESALLILLAITIVVSLQAVGIALMLALLVTPAATAYLVTRRLPAMMAVACLSTTLSGILGLYLSFYASVAAGPAVVLVCTMFFIITYLATSLRRRRTESAPVP